MSIMKLKTAFNVFVAIVISGLAGAIGSLFTTPAVTPAGDPLQASWYDGLVKPAWNPPSWVFGPVWTVLYVLMGIASYLVWTSSQKAVAGQSPKATHRKRVRGALAIFGVQLLLNATWSGLFFGLKHPGWAFAEIIVLWLAIVATIAAFAKISKPAAWLLAPYILWVSFAGYLNYTIWQLNPNISGQTACPAVVETCSDGTQVGPTGPKCEFVCPEPAFDANWKTFTDIEKGITFRYPEALTTTYIQAYDWPPQVAITDGPFACLEAGAENARAGRTELRRVDDRPYCVTKVVEGAAGSIYTQYAYAVEHGPQVLIFTATTRATQCGNYDEPHMAECQQERDAFDFDRVMDRVMQTVTFVQ